MADAVALELQAAAPGTYRQRGVSSLQRLFRSHFPEFAARYDVDYARRLGRSRLQRITRAVERFLECGDYTKGVARIRCTNPDCRIECCCACRTTRRFSPSPRSCAASSATTVPSSGLSPARSTR